MEVYVVTDVLSKM